ncbi:ATP-binding protein, partial [Candidatus Poribacteria bacterium]|nr:ATP-binding protein [Candidatus Poribacteria bacterium]
MLHALELENFKAFGKRARIPFAPITLIFGENSAGKSTILQALYLLKQTRESRESDAPLLPRTENGIVDLGSFQEMLFDHDLKRTLSIRVNTDLDRELAIEFSFKSPSLEAEVLLDQIQIYDGKSSKCIARFQPSGTTVDRWDLWMTMGSFRDRQGLSPAKLAAVRCVWLTKATEYWEPEFELC